MPSGKQISFQYGEVSPALQYRVDADFYSAAVKTLKNMFVRKAGGVSNRPGLRYLGNSTFQTNLLTAGGKPKVKIYGHEMPSRFPHLEAHRAIIEQSQLGTSDLIADSLPSLRTRKFAVLKMYRGAAAFFEYEYFFLGTNADHDGYQFFGSPNLIGGRIVSYGGDVALVYGDGYTAFFKTDTTGIWGYKRGFEPSPLVTTATSRAAVGVLTSSGGPPFLPVGYLITQELTDGTETPMTYATGAHHPHAGNQVHINLTMVRSPTVKQYNIYRSDGGINANGSILTKAEVFSGQGGHWALVGRMPSAYHSSASTAKYSFSDFLLVPQFSTQPPLDRRLYGINYGVQPGGAFREDRFKPQGMQTSRQRRSTVARLYGHYQQRRVVIPPSRDPLGALTGFDEGTVIVSKAGTPDMLDTPSTAGVLSAFEFTLPIGHRNPIYGLLDRLPRLVLFTEKAVVVVQGGVEGLLSRASINPQVISTEGCSKFIAPVSIGDSGYFINGDHTKLMGISFGGEGRDTGAQIVDVSLLADHILRDNDVMGLEAIRGVEDIVYILLTDGTMAMVTVSAGLTESGWSTFETEGYIESITKLNREKDNTRLQTTRITALRGGVPEPNYEALYCSVIRAGVRSIQALSYRSDKESDSEQQIYLDASVTFGKYNRYIPVDDSYENPLLNITTGTTYLAGEMITISVSSGEFIEGAPEGGTGWHDYENLTGIPGHTNPYRIIYIGDDFSPRDDIDYKIDFFYEVAGVTTRARFTPVSRVRFGALTGTFDVAVPAHLQDAAALAASTMLKDQTRWQLGFNRVAGLTHLANTAVAVQANGKTICNPNNTVEYPETCVVSAEGVATFPNNAYYNYGVIGLPYEAVMETLDLDTGGKRTFTDNNKLINRTGIAVYETRGCYLGNTGAGDTENDLTDMVRLADSRNVLSSEVSGNMNGHFNLPLVGSGWEKTGRLLVKQVDPEPITVLAVYPKGMISDEQ